MWWLFRPRRILLCGGTVLLFVSVEESNRHGRGLVVKAFILESSFHRRPSLGALTSTTTATTISTLQTTRTSTRRLFLSNEEEQQQELATEPSTPQRGRPLHFSSYDGQLSEHTFAELYSDHVPSWLMERLQKCDWIYPTLIQERTLNALFVTAPETASTDPTTTTTPAATTTTIPNSMVIQAQTGSGKTLTYLIPLLAQIQHRSAIQAMIVVPTRELGLQVAKVAKRLASGAPHKILIMSLLQGSTLKRQRAWAWAETPQVVIGTPCELLDMVQYGGLPRINSIQYVVVDEVDACLVHQSGASFGTSSSSSSTNSLGSGNDSEKDTKALASALHILLSQHLSPTYSVDDGTMFLDDSNRAALLQGSSSSSSSSLSSSSLSTAAKRTRPFQSRQTIFASATIPQHRHFLKQCQANQWTLEQPMFICTSPGESMPPTLQHGYVVCATKELKVAALRRLLKKLTAAAETATPPAPTTTIPTTTSTTHPKKKILIFCDTIRPMEEMAQAIAHDFGGVCYQEGKTTEDDESQAPPMVSVLRMEESLSQRAGATDAFRSDSNPLTFLLTGDLAARGLDIAGITHVIHFDVPPNADTYLHRSGRAGRLGRKGQVLSIITPEQEFVLERLANALQLSDQMTCVGRQKVVKKKKQPTTDSTDT